VITRRKRRDQIFIISVLVLILGLAAVLRFYGLGAQSLWSDEGNSAALAARPWIQIARDAARDIHPPLYYWLLKLWTTLVGRSEVALRSLSALMGVILVLVVAELGRQIHDEGTGLAAALFAALAPFQVYYSQEARMYILLALECALSVLAFWLYVQAEERRVKPPEGRPAAAGGAPARPRLVTIWGFLLALWWVVGLYTHYAFPIMIALESALYFVWLWDTRSWDGQARRRLLRWALMVGLACVAYVPWLAVTYKQVGTWQTANTFGGWWEALRAFLIQLVQGPISSPQIGRGWLWALLALVALGALPWPAGQRASQHESLPLRLMRWLTIPAWALAPLAMMLVLGLFREAYVKFLLIASPAFCLLLARATLGPTTGLQSVAAQPSSAGGNRTLWRTMGVIWTVACLALVGTLSGAILYRYYNDPAVARDDYRGIAEFIVATGHSNDAIVLDAPGQAEVFSYYYRGDLPVRPLPSQRPLDPAATVAELGELVLRDKVYAIYWATDEADPNGVIEKWLNSQGYKTMDQWRGNVRLAVYQMPEHKPPDDTVTGLDLPFGEDIMLTGYQDWNQTTTAGQVNQLQLNWRALRAPSRRYKVFLQLLDARDQVIAQRDSEPVGDSRPTDTWKAGETIVDNHGLLIPPGTPPGSYRRILGLYDPDTLERLLLPTGSDYFSLPPIAVTRAKTPPPLAAFSMQHNQQFDFGGISLLGHDHYKRGFGHAPDTPLLPGDRLHITFYWRANIAPRADWWFDLTLSDESGEAVASLQSPLVGATYPTTVWKEGDSVRGEHDLVIPDDLPAGNYRLSLVLYPDVMTPAGTAYLGSVTVSPKAN